MEKRHEPPATSRTTTGISVIYADALSELKTHVKRGTDLLYARMIGIIVILKISYVLGQMILGQWAYPGLKKLGKRSLSASESPSSSSQKNAPQ